MKKFYFNTNPGHEGWYVEEPDGTWSYGIGFRVEHRPLEAEEILDLIEHLNDAFDRMEGR